MRDFIAERLSEIKDLESRALLKSIMSDVFLPMYDETEAKYAALEQRIRNELPLFFDVYTIYCTLLQRGNVDGEHTYLSAVIPEDTREPILNLKDIVSDERPILETVFYEADYFKCRQITFDSQILNGAFIVEGERYPFKFQLAPSGKYMGRVESLYSAFIRNAIPWTTVNCAYFSKFFDIKITQFVKIPPMVRLYSSKIEYDFGVYSNAIRRDLIPVWNVDRFRIKGNDYPIPVAGSVNFEHYIEIDKLGDECGFLVDYDSAHILHTRREGNMLVVASPQKNELTWDMYRFRHRQDTEIEKYPYPVISNEQRDSFSKRLMTKYGTHIATKAEMRKLLDSFEVSKYVQLSEFHFTSDNISGDTYDMNPFIVDEVRDPAFQKTLVLVFTTADRGFFLARDTVSFLVSELQASYPEYRCVGTLI